MVPSYLRSTYRLCQQHQSILYVIIFFDEKILQKFTELPDVPPEYFQGHQGVNALSTQELPTKVFRKMIRVNGEIEIQQTLKSIVLVWRCTEEYKL